MSTPLLSQSVPYQEIGFCSVVFRIQSRERRGKEIEAMNVEGSILLVEDRPEWRRRLTRYLQKEGYFVETAKTYTEALDVLARGSFEVVLVDLRLVDWDTTNVQGMQILRHMDELRKEIGKESGTQAIVVTAYPTVETVREAFRDHGVSDILFKPDFDLHSFTEAVRDAAVKAHKIMDKIIASEELASLNRRIYTHKRSLNVLEEQIAPYNINPPLHLVHQIGHERDQIAQIEARRKELLEKLMR